MEIVAEDVDCRRYRGDTINNPGGARVPTFAALYYRATAPEKYGATGTEGKNGRNVTALRCQSG